MRRAFGCVILASEFCLPFSCRPFVYQSNEHNFELRVLTDFSPDFCKMQKFTSLLNERISVGLKLSEMSMYFAVPRMDQQAWDFEF